MRGFAVVALLLAGCSSPEGVGTVSGEVTFDGQPLKDGVIRFVPSDGKTPTVSCSIVNGRYTGEVPLGPKKVEISASKVVGKRKMYDTPDSPTVDKVAELLPPRYNVQSELSMTVKPGKQEQRYDLKSK